MNFKQFFFNRYRYNYFVADFCNRVLLRLKLNFFFLPRLCDEVIFGDEKVRAARAEASVEQKNVRCFVINVLEAIPLYGDNIRT